MKDAVVNLVISWTTLVSSQVWLKLRKIVFYFLSN